MFIKTFQKCSFLSIFRYNDDFTLRGVNKGTWRSRPRSSCLPALSALQLKTLATLKTNHLNHFQKQIEQHVGSALDGIKIDLSTLLLGLIRSYFFRSYSAFQIRSKTNVPRRLYSINLICKCVQNSIVLFDLIQVFNLTFFDLKQTPLDVL